MIQDSICYERDISEADLHSPNTMDLEPFSDFESNFHCTKIFFTLLNSVIFYRRTHTPMQNWNTSYDVENQGGGHLF